MHHIFIVSLSSPRQKTNCHKWWLGTLCVAVSGAAETLCVFAFNSCWSASLSLHEARRVVGQATNRCCFSHLHRASLSLHEARRVVGQATNRCCFSHLHRASTGISLSETFSIQEFSPPNPTRFSLLFHFQIDPTPWIQVSPSCSTP
jgi:hypothetical protein